MDHRWGRLIWELGLGHTGATLASHFLGLPQVMITNEKVPFGNQCRVWTYFPDTGPVMSPSYLGIVGFHPRFPYGFNVVPDAPV